jgi:hypothetical protein
VRLRARRKIRVQTLTIGTASLESALGFFESLRGFHAKLINTEDGRHGVRITLEGGGDVRAALDALDRHASEAAVSARLDLDGRHYLIERAALD